MKEIEVYTERIDDVPLLMAFQNQMGLPEVLDAVIKPHGNRKGLSFGELTSCWLTYIISRADHRMNVVEGWADKIESTLSAILNKPVDRKDFTDDRLADILYTLSKDDLWEEIERRLSERILRVYELPLKRFRVDSTTASVYHSSEV